ncbi:MAG: LEPR-XLL domain-containing protein, partial [Pseudomonadota bacterium]
MPLIPTARFGGAPSWVGSRPSYSPSHEARKRWINAETARARRKAAAAQTREVVFEPLEQRYLLSADFMPFTVDLADPEFSSDITLRLNTANSMVEVHDTGNPSAGPRVSQKLSETSDIQIIGQEDEDNALRLDFSTHFFKNIFFSGRGGFDQLIIGGSAFTSATFQFEAVGFGAVALASGTSEMTISFAGVEPIIAEMQTETVSLEFGDTDDAVELSSAADPGRTSASAGAAPLVEFVDPTSSLDVHGGGGDDSFTLHQLDGDFAVSLDGGEGDDTLASGDDDNLWMITGEDAGDLNGAAFVDVENLTGGAGDDVFQFMSGGSISGVVDGGGGNNTLDFSAQTVNVVADLDLGTASLTGAVRDVQNAVGGAGDDTLTGTIGDNILLGGLGNDVFNGLGGNDQFFGAEGDDTLIGLSEEEWLVTNLNAGTFGGSTFEEIENLTGGLGNDRFGFSEAGSLSGEIDGGGGDNTLDYSATAA